MSRVLRFFQKGLREKPRVALAVALAIFAATALHTITRPKIYEATATFVMKPREVIETAEPPNSLRCGIQCGEDINTFVKAVESTLIARRIAKHLSVSEKSRLLSIFDAPTPQADGEDKLVEALKRSRRVQKSPLGQQIGISFRYPAPDDAARIATLFAEEVRTWMKQVHVDESERALEDLSTRIEQEQKRLLEVGESTPVSDTTAESMHALKLETHRELLRQLIHRKQEVSASLPHIAEHLAVLPAEVPDSPVSPHIPLRLSLGLLAAFALGPLASATAARRESTSVPG